MLCNDNIVVSAQYEKTVSIAKIKLLKSNKFQSCLWGPITSYEVEKDWDLTIAAAVCIPIFIILIIILAVLCYKK